MLEFLQKMNLRMPISLGREEGFVALDIGSSSIKMVETQVEKSAYRVVHLGVLPLPSKAIQNNLVFDQASVIDTIRRLIQENGVKSNKVISAVPGRAVIMKKIQMPMQEEDELEANLEFEANAVIPENLENVNLDYQVLNVLEDGRKLEVLLVAVKKEIVNSYTDVIQAAGLTPAIMDVDYFALENMYEANYDTKAAEGGVIGLIHVGARYTSITLLHKGVSIFTGDLPIGGEEFTENLQREMNISIEAAEKFKVTRVLDGYRELDLETALRPMVENLTQEIRRTVSLYGAVPSDEGEGLKAIYLSGGSAKLPGLCELLQERMGVPVKPAEPFRSFTLGKNVGLTNLVDLGTLFAVSAGLSIRRPGDR
jgi:type IV pilus assembly protein PilM